MEVTGHPYGKRKLEPNPALSTRTNSKQTRSVQKEGGGGMEGGNNYSSTRKDEGNLITKEWGKHS